jgi:hypothetical protein
MRSRSALNRRRTSSEQFWGDVWMWNRGSAARWSASRILISIPVFADDPVSLRTIGTQGATRAVGELLPRVGQSIVAWWDTVVQWCDAFTVYATRPPSTVRVNHIEDVEMWLVHGVDEFSQPGGPDHDNQRLTVTRLDDFEGVSRLTFERVLRLVDSGQAPSLARQFLRLSREQLDAGGYRAAVIDAATAVELACTERLDLELGSLPPGLASAIADHQGTLGRRMDFLRSAGVVTRSKRETEPLLSARNNVAHRGTDTEPADARAAIAIAASLLDQLEPLVFP